jgi:hypothetical protein
LIFFILAMTSIVSFVGMWIYVLLGI